MEKQGKVIYLNPNIFETETGLVSLEDELAKVLTHREQITKEFSEKRNEIKRR
jgi:hypothetical protein